MSQGLDKACLVQRFLAQALNLCLGLLVSSLGASRISELSERDGAKKSLDLRSCVGGKLDLCYYKAGWFESITEIYS